MKNLVLLKLFFNQSGLLWRLWRHISINCASILLFERVHGYLKIERANYANFNIIVQFLASFVCKRFSKSKSVSVCPILIIPFCQAQFDGSFPAVTKNIQHEIFVELIVLITLKNENVGIDCDPAVIYTYGVLIVCNYFAISISAAALFAKRTDVLPKALMKSQSRKVRV